MPLCGVSVIARCDTLVVWKIVPTILSVTLCFPTKTDVKPSVSDSAKLADK